MKVFAVIVSVFVLLGYVALMRVDSAWGLLYPRGGMVMLALSLAIANVAIWAGMQAHRPLNTRFQIAAAGWIWIAVQSGGLAYLYSQSGAA